MKKFLLSLILLYSIFSLSAQIEKGSVLIGGNAGFQFKATHQKASDLKTTEFVFSATPYALYSVIKQLSLGGQISYAYALTKLKDSNGVRSEATNLFTLGPALRGNFFIGGKTFLFIHASPSFGINVTRDPTDRNDTYASTSIVSWRIGPGLSIFTSKCMAVELGLYYDGMKNIVAIKQNKNVLLKGNPYFTHGLTVAVGLQFYIHKKLKTSSGSP